MAKRSFHIVHVANVEPDLAGGMARVAWHWRRRFQDRGHLFQHVGPQEVGRAWHYSTFSWQARRYVARLQRKPDILLLHESAAWAFAGVPERKVTFSHGLEARFALTLARLEPHRPWLRRCFAKIYQGLIWRAHCRASKVLLINQQDRNYCRAREMERAKLRVFNNGVNPSGLAAVRDYRKPGPLTILFNGSWIPRKGVLELVAAAAQLAAQGLPARWKLIGTGATEGDIRAVWPAALMETLEVVPRFPAEDEAVHLAAADLFVLPSFFEGKPLSLLQAMEAGLPCVTTDCCGQRDLIEHGNSGLLFKPGNLAQLTTSVASLLQDASLRERLGQAGAAAVRPLTWDSVADEVVDLVERATC